MTREPPPVIRHAEPASRGQRMLWLIERQRGRRGQLNYPLLLRLRGPVEPAALAAAVDGLVARHETLRTTLARRDGLLTQLVHEPAPVPLRPVDARGLDAAGLDRAVRAETSAPLDPAHTPLRATVWTVDDRHRVLCLNTHHFATDAVSCRILTEDLSGLLGGHGPLPPVGWQYRHYVRWLRRETTAPWLDAEYDYWRRRLDAAEPVALPAGSGARLDGNRTIQVDFDRTMTGALKAVARAAHTTLYTVLLAIFYTALHQETGQVDLSLASPFANRGRPEIQRTVGFFANMLILRTRTAAGMSFVDLLRRTHETVHEARVHQGVAWYAVPGASTGAARASLGNVAFQLLPDLPGPAAPHGVELDVLPPYIDGRFDFELTAIPHGAGLRALFQYEPDRVADSAAQRVAAAYRDQAARVAAGG